MSVVRTKAGIEREVDLLRGLDLSKPWEVTVKPYRRNRRKEQNAYYWGVCVRAVVEHTGHDPDDIHEYALMECFGTEAYEVMGLQRIRPTRTTTRPQVMTIDEFNAYVEWFKAWAAHKVGVTIPDAGETNERL